MVIQSVLKMLDMQSQILVSIGPTLLVNKVVATFLSKLMAVLTGFPKTAQSLSRTRQSDFPEKTLCFSATFSIAIPGRTWLAQSCHQMVLSFVQ